MRNIAEFTLIGRVGTIKPVGKTVRVSICACYPFKDDKGQRKEDAHRNEVDPILRQRACQQGRPGSCAWSASPEQL